MWDTPLVLVWSICEVCSERGFKRSRRSESSTVMATIFGREYCVLTTLNWIDYSGHKNRNGL
jgi:hypothetical protein